MDTNQAKSNSTLTGERDLRWQRALLGRRWIGIGMAGLVLLGLCVFPWVVSSPTHQHVLIQVFFYATLAQSWNVLGGYAGQFSLGHAVFIGAGAYTSSLLLVKFGVSPWIGLAAGILVALLLAVAIGKPLFELKGHYLAVSTWLLVEIVRALVIHWRWAGGAMGIHLPFKGNSPLLLQFNSKIPYYYIYLTVTVLVYAAVYLVERSKPGYIFKAIREDEKASTAVGVNALHYKLLAFSFYAAFGAAMGTLHAQYVLVITPDTLLTIDDAILAMLMAVLGGMGTVWGPLLGAFILAPLTEYTRIFLGGQGRAISPMVLGFFIILLGIYEPEGLIRLIRKLKRRATSL